jgi:hypothetical protein
VLANWTDQEQVIGVSDSQLDGSLMLHISGRELTSRDVPDAAGGIRITLPPLSCAVVE